MLHDQSNLKWMLKVWSETYSIKEEGRIEYEIHHVILTRKGPISDLNSSPCLLPKLPATKWQNDGSKFSSQCVADDLSPLSLRSLEAAIPFCFHFACLLQCASYILTSFLRWLLDNSFPSLSLMGIPFSSHSLYLDSTRSSWSGGLLTHDGCELFYSLSIDAFRSIYHWGKSCDRIEHCSSRSLPFKQSQKYSYNFFPFSLLTCPWYWMDLPCCLTLDIKFACGTTTREHEETAFVAKDRIESVVDSASPHNPVVKTGRFSSVDAACSTCAGVVDEAKLI